MLLVSSGAAQSVLQLVVVLIIFAVVLILTYFTTKWIAGYQKKRGSGANVEVIETAKIGNDRYIEIVRVGKRRYFVLALGKNEVTTVGEISADDIISVRDAGASLSAHGFSTGGRFSDLFEGLKKKNGEEQKSSFPDLSGGDEGKDGEEQK